MILLLKAATCRADWANSKAVVVFSGGTYSDGSHFFGLV